MIGFNAAMGERTPRLRKRKTPPFAGLTTLSTLPALGLRFSLLPTPDPNPDHEEDDNNYDRQNYADHGTARDRGTAPEGVMIGEGWGGEQRHQGSGGPLQRGHGGMVHRISVIGNARASVIGAQYDLRYTQGQPPQGRRP